MKAQTNRQDTCLYTNEETKQHFGFDISEEREFERVRNEALKNREELDVHQLYMLCMHCGNSTLNKLVDDLPDWEIDTSDHEEISDAHLRYFGFI